jgi:alpha-N-acetylglucosaminidase
MTKTLQNFRLISLCLGLMLGLQLLSLPCRAADDVEYAKQLAERLLGKSAKHIIFKKMESPDGSDRYELESKQGDVVISGNSANSMAVGLNHYLKYYCLVSVGWEKHALNLPASLPIIPEKETQKARCKDRFFLNYCTFGYTMPWWQWNDWEWFIDWMALNGINMPLAITGQEAVWYKVWKSFGLSDQQIRSFFTGPAFLPWHRMANLDHWGGPLPMSWINGQELLQKKIVKRERELNMKPVLPAFAGHVPEMLKSKFPAAKISSLGDWGGFDKQYHSFFLDPFDPMFSEIQKRFLTEQTKLFGSDHIYGTDPFNEVTPPSWEPSYLGSVSKAIYNSLQEHDKSATWLQMSWIFYFQREQWTNPRIEAFLKAVPQGKMMLLDYYADSTEVWKFTDKFFGQPYLWCYLGNFGSNTMLVGNLKDINRRLDNAFLQGGDNLAGIGSTLEGFGANPIMYEFLFEKAWSGAELDPDKWVRSWADRRTGKKDVNAENAWEILINKVYKQAGALGQGSLTNARPTLHDHGGWVDPKIAYQNKDLLEAWRLMLAAKQPLSQVYQYDLVNVGRQVLGNHFAVLRNRFTLAYEKHDVKAIEINGNKMMQVIADMDQLLATNSSFLLGKWITDAREIGISPQEKDYYEQDARTILSTWGAQGSALTDYANRNWSGLMNDYYGKRWFMFITSVKDAAQSHTEFDQKQFDSKSAAFEWNWTKQKNVYPMQPKGNSWAIGKKLYDKYAGEIRNAELNSK